jgi:glutamine synthetase
MVYTKPITTVAELPVWNFDGSSTKQATTGSSDVLIRPVAMYTDPFRGAPHLLVLTETLNSDYTPHATNSRAKAVEIFKKAEGLLPQFGIEQEYILFEREFSPHTYLDANGVQKTEMLQLPYKWVKHGEPGLGGQGPYYCSVGGGTAFGRDIAEEHLDKCLAAGVKICGINAEVMASQWEFQVGICDGIEMGDMLWIARYILFRVVEKHQIDASFHPKPYRGDWNGSGLHTNFSTRQMREGEGDKKGLEFIEAACEKLCDQKKHEEHMAVYGSDNHMRMTGAHETAGMDKCTWGRSDRSKSLRIPILVAQKGKGYMEDRRVASNADPYLVTMKLVETTCL